jgi:hypothetical protein
MSVKIGKDPEMEGVAARLAQGFESLGGLGTVSDSKRLRRCRGEPLPFPFSIAFRSRTIFAI